MLKRAALEARRLDLVVDAIEERFEDCEENAIESKAQDIVDVTIDLFWLSILNIKSWNGARRIADSRGTETKYIGR
jgi:hypothetical protein